MSRPPDRHVDLWVPDLALSQQLAHYEALKGSAIDEQEAVMRRKLSQPWRRLDAAPE